MVAALRGSSFVKVAAASASADGKSHSAAVSCGYLPSRSRPAKHLSFAAATSSAEQRTILASARKSATPASAASSRLQVFCSAAAPGEVRPTSVLVVGGTGTLGRQIVRRLLDEGYEVRCMVRPRPLPADFLRDWGASTVQADLSKHETIPPALVGIHTIIDAATARPEEPMLDVDWEGKVALMKTAKAMGIQRYIFFSINKCDEHNEVPLMQVKYKTEKYLAQLGLNYTVLRLCGFMQGLIGQYAVPILEERSVWGTNDKTKIAYMDTQDIARLTLNVLKEDKTIGSTLTLAGPSSYSSSDIVKLCVELSGVKKDPDVTEVPVIVLKVLLQALRFFQWAQDAADRLAFAEVLSSEVDFTAPKGEMDKTYALIGANPEVSRPIHECASYAPDWRGF